MAGDCEAFRPLASAAADGELSAGEREALHAHLRVCADCRGWAATAEALALTIRTDVPAAPPWLPVARLRRRMPSRRRRAGALAVAAACAAIAAAALGGGTPSGQQEEATASAIAGGASQEPAGWVRPARFATALEVEMLAGRLGHFPA
jgi:predicted anti-sigma-YlaC factor YlaD